MRRIISALLFCISIPLALAQATKPLELAEGAPERHTVVRGDTLWDLAAKYLKDPYRWGELWKMNAQQIKRPHWIYPGQVLVLDKRGPTPQLTLAVVKEPLREYIEPQKHAIPAISPREIEPFLSRPLVLDQAGLDAAPRVVALQDGRVIAGAGDTVYTTGVAVPGKAWQIFRPGKPLIDPETRETLGWEAQFIGTARMTANGVPASFLLLTTSEEVAVGDRLLPTPRTDVMSYLPHPPEKAIAARVLAIYGGVNFGGPQSVVVLNRGSRDGLEMGHVLSVDQAGEVVEDRYQGKKTEFTLPNARNGLVFVFRVFDRVAYALVMGARQPVVVGDSAHTP
ncbi:MAG: LysM domain-containing protein [Rugosibacter sp.]|nr:LysM domain-containing protein [Rugosibacter sp.]